MRLFVFLTALLAFSLQVSAQNSGTISGTIYDSTARQTVANATITLLQEKDSALVSFTMTDNSGYFRIQSVSDGRYRLLVSHVNYHNAQKFIQVEAPERLVDAGPIFLTDKSILLSEVVVTSEAPPVTLVGDTIQYNAGSFKVQPNASVEQLLKKLPGIQVNKDGSIKAQGETVNRVMVDGKEFFGSDPKIATRNLPADAVDKVQVYDKQSEQARLTGFDDGNSEKTINLKLKADKKKGSFGKAMAGGGTNDRFEGKTNFNSFKGARQLSAIGMANNTNAEGFSFMDILNFTGEMQRMQSNAAGGGRMQVTLSNSDAAAFGGGGSNNTGINTTMGGGFNYNNIIGKKTDFTSNYFYNRYNPLQQSIINRQYFLPDSSFTYQQQALTDNVNNNHRLNLGADVRIDSMHSIKISPSISYQQTDNRSAVDYSTLTQEGVLNNQGFSNSRTQNNGYNLKNDILFRKKFAQRGRTFSLNLQTSYNSSEGAGDQLSITRFYRQGGLFKTDSINQHSVTAGSLWSYNARATYTEPVFKRSLLEISAANSNSNSTAQKTTYDFNPQKQVYDNLNTMLSNDFQNAYGFTTAGLRFRTQNKKYNYTAGINWQKATLEGKIIAGIKDSVISKTFTNLLPSAKFQYNFTRFKILTLNYRAFTNQPSVTQLQPVPDNSNPLNIRLGNPDLKQEQVNALQLNFTSLNPFRNKNLFVFLNMSSTKNKIVNYDMVNNLGVKTTMPVNVDGVYNLNGNISWGLPAKFVKGIFNLSSSVGYNKGKQFINGVSTNSNTLSLGPTARLESNFTDKLNMVFNAGVKYNRTTYSLASARNTKYMSQEYGAEINWQLPAGFYVATDFTYSINNQLADGFNIQVPLWNASLSRQFLKYNRGELKITSFDLLNQNIGTTRTATGNYIEDKRVQNLRRYFMLSFTYSLTKRAAGNRSPGGINMIMQ